MQHHRGMENEKRRWSLSRLWLLLPVLLTASTSWAQPELVPLGPAFLVNTFTEGGQSEAAVAQDPTGGFVITWHSNLQDGSSFAIAARRFDSNGRSLGSDFVVNTYTTSLQSHPSIGLDPSGGFVIAWTSNGPDGSGFGISAQRFGSDGLPLGGEFTVNTTTASSQRDSRVGQDSSGGFVIAWSSAYLAGVDSGIRARRFGSNGEALGSDFAVNTLVSATQRFPIVEPDPSGGFIVVWASDGLDGSDWGIAARRFDSQGNPRGTEFQVNTWTTGTQWRPDIRFSPTGSFFVVVWESEGRDGSFDGIAGQLYDSGASRLGSEFLVNTWTTSTQREPALGPDPSGGFVAVWASSGLDGSYNGVAARRFDSFAQPMGTDFQVNTYTFGDQLRPEVGPDPDGGFVVVWEGGSGEGSGFGISARRYVPPSATPTATLSPTPTWTPSATPTPTATLSPTTTWTPSATPSPSETATPTLTATETLTPSSAASPTPSLSLESTETPTSTATSTSVPTSPTASATPSSPPPLEVPASRWKTSWGLVLLAFFLGSLMRRRVARIR